MNIAFVIQRYGQEVVGGAELHCRWLAEHLAGEHDVEIITTCAKDYISWRNYFNPGIENINGVKVRRFKVARRRNLIKFGRIQEWIFNNEHSIKQEEKWMKLNGPYSPSLIRYLKGNKDSHDIFIFYSYRYFTSYHGLKEIPQNSVLLPTAEEDSAIKLQIFTNFFKLPNGYIFLTPEERELISKYSEIDTIPYTVIGSGLKALAPDDPSDFKRMNDLDKPYILYIGRIDRNKGCEELFNFFLRYTQYANQNIDLVLIGPQVLEIPKHPRIKHIGYVSEQEKSNAIAGCEFFIMPSFFESLSIAVLEAWNLEKPILANGKCKVLKGQCLRSNGGLFYSSYQEFRECVDLLSSRENIREELGKAGKKYVEENYSWDVVIHKVNDLLSEVSKAKKKSQ